MQVICSKKVLSSLVIQCVPLNMSVWTVCHQSLGLTSLNLISLAKTLKLNGFPFFFIPSFIQQIFSKGPLYARHCSGHLRLSNEQNR